MNQSTRGFTLIELVIVVGLFGLMLAIAVPAIGRLGQSHNLKGARDNVAAQIQLARARAIASGIAMPIHFYPGAMPTYDYHTHPAGAIPMAGFKLPKGVSFATANLSVTMLNNGRASSALVLPLVDRYGHRDTVNVLTSGMVVTR